MIVPLRFDGLPVSAWRNGAGRKADIASSTDWHVGFAWLDANADFSDFTGHDRTITLVDGPGFTLDFVGHPALRVTQRYRPARFDGGWPARCTLMGAPGVVLNAMTARRQCRHVVTLLDSGSPAWIVPGDAEAFFLVLLAGQATVGDGVELGPRDAIHADGPFSFQPESGACACTIAIERGS